jgi:hypothetical protein
VVLANELRRRAGCSATPASALRVALLEAVLRRLSVFWYCSSSIAALSGPLVTLSGTTGSSYPQLYLAGRELRHHLVVSSDRTILVGDVRGRQI